MPLQEMDLNRLDDLDGAFLEYSGICAALMNGKGGVLFLRRKCTETFAFGWFPGYGLLSLRVAYLWECKIIFRSF